MAQDTKISRRDILAGSALLLAPASAAAQGRWIERPDLPYPVQAAAACAWRNQVLIAGGMTTADGRVSPTDKSVLYDPAVEHWREWGKLPYPRHGAGLAAVYTDRYASAGFADAFILGGYRSADAGNWVAVRQVMLWDLIWTEVEPMPLFQSEAVAVGVEGIVHLVGGRAPKGEANKVFDDHAEVAAHQIYDPGENRWYRARPCPAARHAAAGAEIDGKLYLVGGRTVAQGPSARLDRYDPQTDRWETLRPAPKPAWGLAAAAFDGSLYAFGGQGAGGLVAETWVYDPKTDRWGPAEALKTPRRDLAAVSLKEGVYVAGGALSASGETASKACHLFRPTQATG